MRGTGEDLCAWCSLEESEHEECQDVTSTKKQIETTSTGLGVDRQRRKAKLESENQVKVKESMKLTDAMASEAVVSHVMLPNAKLQRSSTKTIRDGKRRANQKHGEEMLPTGQVAEPTIWGASVMTPFIHIGEVLQVGNCVVLDAKMSSSWFCSFSCSRQSRDPAP